MALQEGKIDILLVEILAMAFIQTVGVKEEIMLVAHTPPREEDHHTLEAECLLQDEEELLLDMGFLQITRKVINMEVLVLAGDPM